MKTFFVLLPDGRSLLAQGNYALGTAPVREFFSVDAARAAVAEMVASCARYGYGADAERLRAAQIVDFAQSCAETQEGTS